MSAPTRRTRAMTWLTLAALTLGIAAAALLVLHRARLLGGGSAATGDAMERVEPRAVWRVEDEAGRVLDHFVAAAPGRTGAVHCGA